MIMDTLAGIAFSYEAPLLEYMKEKPKDKNEKIVDKYMLVNILIMGFYCALVSILFLKLPLFRFMIVDSSKNIMTAYFAIFVFMGIFNAMNYRTTRLNILANLSKNIVFIIIFLLIFLVQIFIIYYGKDLFRTYGLSIGELLYVIVLSISVIPVNLMYKFIIKK